MKAEYIKHVSLHCNTDERGPRQCTKIPQQLLLCNPVFGNNTSGKYRVEPDGGVKRRPAVTRLKHKMINFLAANSRRERVPKRLAYSRGSSQSSP